MGTDKIEVYDTKGKKNHKVLNMIVRIICLFLPVIFAFTGNFLAPRLWPLLNKDSSTPESFRFFCSLFFFAIPAVVIFIESRTLNPIINIMLKEKK